MGDVSDLADLRRAIDRWGVELGFQQIGVAGVTLHQAEQQLAQWLAAGYHGEMGWMAHHGIRRSRPAALLPGTLRALSARFDYLPPAAAPAAAVLRNRRLGYISRYALGRDYHKVVRRRLQQLADRIAARIGPFGYRVFTDSAPVLEKPLAAAAGLGWVGKHSNLLQRTGSWFFLGEIFVDLPLPIDQPARDHCGRCRACIDICPTAAIVAPYVVDARRCISYLTIELAGPIPEPLRPLMGNRIYGCDDCQLICPWNRSAHPTAEPDFTPRHQLDASELVALFEWDEATFRQRTAGSPIHRIGHLRWLRNIAVALGNAPPGDGAIIAALQRRLNHPSALLQEHLRWALARQQRSLPAPPPG